MTTGFLETPQLSRDVQRLYDADVAERGFVTNTSRLWAHQPTVHSGLFDLINRSAKAGDLTYRQRCVVVVACTSALGDPYCSLAWGERLARVAGADVAGGVVSGADDGLDRTERALAGWARKIGQGHGVTGAGDVQALRDVGYDDAQILALTAFAALRAAFAAVNAALGARPDAELLRSAPATLRESLTHVRGAAALVPATAESD
jgi:alkylhydroperoxidase family enzyme